MRLCNPADVADYAKSLTQASRSRGYSRADCPRRTARSWRATTYYLLLATYYSLLTAHCSLLTTHYSLLATDYLPLAAYC